MVRRLTFALAAFAAALALPTGVAGHRNFVPDWTFSGSTLTDWSPLGAATWTANAGELVGTPTSPAGGWLFLKTSSQDVQMATSFRCAAECKAGVLLRAEKTAEGFKGVFVSIDGTRSAAYAVTLDAQGQETSRTPLPPGGGMVRFIAPAPAGRAGAAGPAAAPAATPAPPAAPVASPAPGPAPATAGPAGPPPAAPAPPRGGGGGVNAPLPANAPYTRPVYAYRPGEWNTLEIVMDANILRVWLNDGPEAGVAGGRADDEVGRYGPIAFYAGGTTEVRYRTIETKDLGRRVLPAEKVASRFRMQRLSDFYYAWSATSADVNKDGILDVIAGPSYYLGPDYQVSREIYLSTTNNPSNQYTPAMLNFAHDYTGDGYPDVLVTESRNFVMYVNPGPSLRRWDRYPAFNNGSEVASFKDIDKDGTPDAVVLNGGTVAWASVNKAAPTSPWTIHPVSGPGYAIPAQHGLGAGDLNGDGRVDIVHPYGWWEQPAEGAGAANWPYHPVPFGRWPRAGSSPGGGEMMVFDVNGDSLNDVVTSLEGHGWGLAWYEQVRAASGVIRFAEHMIMDNPATKNPGGVSFSEVHALTAADVDGDGVLDIITGKRAFAHNESYTDPDPYGAPVLYWFRTARNPKVPEGVEFVPELIHNRSGVGSMVQTADLNKDGALDILTSTNRGTFVFWGSRTRR